MYEDFFGFKEAPFHITPNPHFLFASPTHSEVLRHLHYGIKERKGFIVLTGEVGCGKTTLCRKLLEDLDQAQYETALILNPRVSETQLLRAILHELGEPSDVESSEDLSQKINTALLHRIQQGKDIILIIDEAQNLSFEVMEQVRLLSNLETNEQKLLQIILMGQPELKYRLKENRLRQLRQRILVYCELRPLTLSETRIYIHHRMSLAGSQGRPEFTPWAVRKVYQKSRGIPRIINNICDKSLLSAFIRTSTEQVTRKDVKRAIQDIENLNPLS